MLVGRQRDIGRVAAALAGFEPVVVVGDTGVGKTTVAREAVVAAGFEVVPAACFWSMREDAYFPLRGLLAGVAPGADVQAVAESVRLRVGVDGALLLDDMHWADPSTLRALGLLTGRVPMVCTFRTDEHSPSARAVLAEAGFRETELAPLAVEDAVALARRLRPDLGPERIERAVAAAGGNPLFLEQLVVEERMSEDVRAALRRRLGALSSEGRQALCRLALVGRSARPAEVGPGAAEVVAADVVLRERGRLRLRHGLLGEVAIGDLDDGARRALSRDLAAAIREPAEAARHAAAAGDRETARRLALRAAERAALPGLRAAMLALAASCSEDALSDRLRLDAAAALVESAEFTDVPALTRAASGPDAATRAEACLREAQALLQLDEIDRAEVVVREGLDLVTGSRTLLEVDLLCEQARLKLYAHFDVAGARALADDAAAVARAGRLPRYRCEFTLGLAGVSDGREGWDVHLRRAVAGARRAGDREAETEAVEARVVGHLGQGDYEPARRIARRAEAGCREQGLLGRSQYFRVYIGAADVFSGRLGHVAAEMGDLLEESTHPRVRDLATALLALAHADLGDDIVARALLKARDEGDAGNVWDVQCRIVRAEVELVAGRPRRAVELADEFLVSTRVQDFPLLVLGRLGRAWACVEIGRDPGPPLPTLPLAVLAGAAPESEALALLHKEGPTAAVVDLLEEAAALWAGGGVRFQVRCLWGAGDTARRMGDNRRAARLLESAAAVAASHRMEPMARRILRSQRLAGIRVARPSPQRRGGLSLSEGEVVRLARAGLSHREIARRLGLAHTTVLAYAASAGDKLAAGEAGAITGTPPLAVVLGPGARQIAGLVAATEGRGRHADALLVDVQDAAGAARAVQAATDGRAVVAAVEGSGELASRLSDDLRHVGDVRSVDTAAAGPLPGLEDVDRRLLGHLLAGATVAAAATGTGLSRRSAHRRLAAMRDDWGVSSSREMLAAVREVLLGAASGA